MTPREHCRNWIGNDRCSNEAIYILWGKLFPPELLGPRCYTCAVDQLTAAGYHSYTALQKKNGYAIYHIPTIPTVTVERDIPVYRDSSRA